MLLTEETNKRVVVVYGTEGQAQVHGPFDTEGEACWYVKTIAPISNETFRRVLGFEVDHVAVRSIVRLIGMVEE